MPQLNRVALGRTAREYVIGVLGAGGPLPQVLVARISGSTPVSTWAARDADAMALDSGVAMARSAKPTHLGQGQMAPILDPGRESMVGLIVGFLETPGSMCILDDPWRKLQDKDGSEPGMSSYLGSNIAHRLPSGSSATAIDAALRRVLTWEWSGILADSSDCPSLEGASSRDITEIATRTKFVFVPAFDHEGWAIAELA
jgi:hypothetical protein